MRWLDAAPLGFKYVGRWQLGQHFELIRLWGVPVIHQQAARVLRPRVHRKVEDAYSLVLHKAECPVLPLSVLSRVEATHLADDYRRARLNQKSESRIPYRGHIFGEVFVTKVLLGVD